LNRLLILALFAVAGSLSAQTDVLRVNFGTSAIETDPARGQTALEAQVLTALYEGLVAYDPQSLRAVPGAAQTWQFSEDGLTLTFTLRPDLVFEDGEPLTAATFRDTFLRVLNPTLGAPFASLLDPVVGAQAWREGRLKDPRKLGIEALDDRTLVLRLAEPAPHLVAVLCHYAFVPVHPAWRRNPTADAPPANGPYRLVKAEAGRWSLEKNPRYWDAAQVKIPRLEFQFSDDSVAVTKAFKEGAFDWVADGIDGNTTLGSRYLSANAVFGTSFLYFKAAKAPWTNPKVRQALILLLPLEDLRKGYLQPTSVLIPQFQGYPKLTGLEQTDRDRALSLLQEAGFPNGKGLPTLTIAFPEGRENEGLAQRLIEAWKGLDFTVDYQAVKGSYYDQVGALDHSLGFYSWIGDFLDPVTFLVLWKGGSSLNSFSYLDPAYDALLTKAATQKADERLKTLSEAETLLLQGGLLVPLSHTPSFHLIDRDEIGGWYPNALDIHPFKNLYRKPPKPLKNLARFDLSGNL